MKTVTEQLVALRATREAHEKAMQDAVQKSLDENRSMNTAEAEQFDEAEAAIKTIDADIERLSKLEAIQKASAQPADKLANESRVASDEDRTGARLKRVEKLEPGIAFARYAMCLTAAKGNHAVASQLAQKHYPLTESINQVLKAQAEGANLEELIKLKGTVAAGTTLDSTWAAPLVYAENYMGDFVEYLRPRTLIGQAQFRPVPFNVRIGGQTSGGTANWVGQGKPKPVTKFDFIAQSIPFAKVAAIAVIGQELARFSSPSAEVLVRDTLADCVIAKVDADLFDPDVAAVANISPAGLLNGVAPIVGAGSVDYSDPDTVDAAINALWAPWDSSLMGSRPAYYTTPAVARNLASAKTALGVKAYPNMTMFGGNISGVPVRVSQYLANNGGSGGAPFILVDESEIYLADDGSVTLDQSDQVSLEMSDTPTNSSSASVTATQLVSMWQTNSIAFRAERFIWWGPRRSGAIQWMDGFPTA